MTYQYAKSIRKKLRELAGLAHEQRGLGDVAQFISLYRQEGNPRKQPLKKIFDSSELQEDSVSSILEHTAGDELEEKSNGNLRDVICKSVIGLGS